MRLFLLFCIFALSCLQAQTSKEYHLQVQRGIDKILSSVDKNVHVGVEVVSLKTGMRLYEKNSHQLFTPASVAKIFTAGAALSILGPEFRFETRLLSDGKNLYLQGSGDPSFTLRDLEDMIVELRIREIKEIEGDLVIDNCAFDSVAKGPGWMWDDISGFSFALTNALTINHNVVSIWVKPSEQLAAPPHLFVHPKTGFIKIHNLAVTDEQKNGIVVERLAHENTIEVKGEVPLKSDFKTFRVPVEDPHLYAASLMKQVLQKEGVELKGKVRVEKTPLQAQEWVSHTSPPLVVLLSTMLKDSDNLYADNVFKKLEKGSSGSWEGGRQALLFHLEEEAQLKIEDLVLVDGSGLSRYNLLSPHQIVEYLKWMHASPFAPEFLGALSLGGRDGTLRRRFQPSLRLRGKDGLMTGITGLSGYLHTEDGEPLAFSIMINGYTGPAKKYRAEVEDRIVSFLVSLKKD